MKIINEIEFGVADIVFYTSAFAEHYAVYITEANKSSGSYDYEACTAAFDRAKDYAKLAILTCEDLGLNPAVVCKDVVSFMDEYNILIGGGGTAPPERGK